jgi:hypothetical protein
MWPTRYRFAAGANGVKPGTGIAITDWAYRSAA